MSRKHNKTPGKLNHYFSQKRDSGLNLGRTTSTLTGVQCSEEEIRSPGSKQFTVSILDTVSNSTLNLHYYISHVSRETDCISCTSYLPSLPL